MKTKIYLGEDVVVGTNQVNRYKIEFSGNPGNLTRIAFDIKKNGSVVENVDKTFNTTTSDISNTIIGATATSTAENLLANLQTYNTNSVTYYSLSEDFNSYGNRDIYIDVVGDINDVFTFTSISNTTAGKAVLVNDGELTTYDRTEVGYFLLDLYKDENIEFTSKLSDIEKLSNVFTDFSNSFSVPATANNNELFKHYYDVDIDNTFNANIRVNAYIEIDSFPLRYGKIQLEAIKLKNQKPDSYKITFYGAVIQLTDLFGDDTIDRLDYSKDEFDVETKTFNSLSQFDYVYTKQNFLDSLNDPSFKDGEVMTPLIALAERDWSYGRNDTTDISIVSSAIKDTELRPALRIANIIEAIETKYNLSFTRNFFGSSQFNNLFLWLNGQDEIKTDYDISFTGFTGPNNGSFTYEDPYLVLQRRKYNDDLNTAYLRLFTFTITPQAGYTSVPYTARILNQFDSELNIEENVTGTETIASSTRSSAVNLGNTELVEDKAKLVITTTQPFLADVTASVQYWKATLLSGLIYYVDVTSTTTNVDTTPIVEMQNYIPKIKVIDFFQGLMKMFKLIIRPLSGNEFYINTLDGYYGDGNVLDITSYIDQTDVNIERPLIYKNITFKYQKTNNILGKQYRETNDPVNDEIGYGDLKSTYASIESKNDLKVELPFENMMFERMTIVSPDLDAGTQTSITIGQSMTVSDDGQTYSENKSKPIMFYNNGLANINETPYKLKFGVATTAETFNTTYIIGNTNDELIEQVTDTINWGAEVDPWHNQIVYNSLYLNYWENWINTIYDLKQRKFTYEGYLPPRFIEELSLNDRLIIGSNRYKINDYKINLSNGKTQFTLFKDIFEWNAYSFPSGFVFNERSFSPNGWYMTDYVNNGDSAYIYGSFTGYNSTAYGRIVKLLPNGDVDTSFNTGTGFNNNSFGFQSIYKQNDGKILATGDFTSFNGTARNRIARLNTDGSLDTSFVVGTGFNGITSGVDVDSQGRIVVCGSYSSYSGVTSQRIIRLNTGGTVNYSTGTNGFNSVTNSVVINSDDSMYVGGYFSTYSGVTSNRLIKLTSGFTVDTSFNVGTGLNSNSSNQPVGLISDVADGVYVYGHFTTYSGISANRLVRLTSTGQINSDWYVGTGFNASITTAYKVLDDKLLIYGTFTQFNGLNVSNGLVVLNANGSIYRTFSGNYVNVFTIGNRFYGNLANGVTELIDDESLPTLSTNSIIANAAIKYYSVNVLKNLAWSVTTVDLGYGTNWITITTPSGSGSSEVVFRVEDKTNESAPALYQPRYMMLRFNFDGVYRDVLVTQNGLIA